MMIIFVNSEKYKLNFDQVSFDQIINLSGYPKNKRYKIIDEQTHDEYFENQIIVLRQNMSLMIQEIH